MSHILQFIQGNLLFLLPIIELILLVLSVLATIVFLILFFITPSRDKSRKVFFVFFVISVIFFAGTIYFKDVRRTWEYSVYENHYYQVYISYNGTNDDAIELLIPIPQKSGVLDQLTFSLLKKDMWYRVWNVNYSTVSSEYGNMLQVELPGNSTEFMAYSHYFKMRDDPFKQKNINITSYKFGKCYIFSTSGNNSIKFALYYEIEYVIDGESADYQYITIGKNPPPFKEYYGFGDEDDEIRRDYTKTNSINLTNGWNEVDAFKGEFKWRVLIYP